MTRGILDPSALPSSASGTGRPIRRSCPAAEEIAARCGWSAGARCGASRAGSSCRAGDGARFRRLRQGVRRGPGVPDRQGPRDRRRRWWTLATTCAPAGRPRAGPRGTSGWRIPRSPGTTWGSVGLTGKSIASSGDYLRSFTVGGRRYGHISTPARGGRLQRLHAGDRDRGHMPPGGDALDLGVHRRRWRRGWSSSGRARAPRVSC